MTKTLKMQIDSTQYKKEITYTNTHTHTYKITVKAHDPEFEVEVGDESTSGK